MDYITSSIAEGLALVILFLDFAKAFDSVDHEKLLIKLQSLGFESKVLEWCKGVLKNRKQRVLLGEFESEWEDVVSGLPQGSVLGPLLFVVFINDITNIINSICKLFADDTKLLRAIKDDTDSVKLQQDIDSLVELANKWSLKFIQQECKVMILGNGQQNL